MTDTTERIENTNAGALMGDGPTFAGLGLSKKTLAGVLAAGYESPTPIQLKAIPLLLTGADVIGQAQTGTGKTAAFALPMIERLDPAVKHPQGLIMCPTRELAVQVSEAIYSLGRSRGFQVAPIYGGQPIDRQLRALRMGVQIVVGTPGRMLDHLRRSTLDLSRVKMVVLDEADEMLDMGFVEDIETILDQLPEERQIGLFSATMPAPIAQLAKKYLKNPQRVTIASERATTPQIRQSYYEVSASHKLDALGRILDMETPGPTIVFCRTRKDADELGEHLRGRGYPAESLHGEMSQKERDRAMARFRQGQVDLLVATDVAARGLDIETVTHVINYTIPWDAEAYTHRIGRTGRAGREGDAITLISPRERRQLKQIERGTGARIMPVRLPTTADIASKRRELFKQTIVEALQEDQFDDFLLTVEELAEEYGPSEVAAAALKLLWQQGKSTISVQELDEPHGPRPEMGMARLFVSLGRQEGVRPGDLVGAIANEAGLSGQSIGSIDILDHGAYVEVPEDAADRVVEALGRSSVRGQKVRVERASATGLGLAESDLSGGPGRPSIGHRGKAPARGPRRPQVTRPQVTRPQVRRKGHDSR